MEDAFFEDGTLSVIQIIASVLPILDGVVAKRRHTNAIDSVTCVVIRDVPVTTVSVGVSSTIEVDRTAEIVPLAIIEEADHIVNLRSGGADFDPRFQGSMEVSVPTFLLNMICEIHRVLISIIRLVCFDSPHSVLRCGASRQVVDISIVRPICS